MGSHNLRRVLLPLTICALLISPSASSLGSSHEPEHSLTVSAAISLKDALDEIQGAFQSANSDTTLHFNFGASGTLQHQIEQGAPVDLYISAAPAQMDALASESLLVQGTRKDLLRNAVVLIAPRNRKMIASFQDLIVPGIKVIAIGEPQTVPAGSYAQQVLTYFGLYDKLRPKYVFAKDVRQVLTYVETDNADAGIVYATDARGSNRVSVVATAPEDSHAPVIYPVAVLSTS